MKAIVLSVFLIFIGATSYAKSEPKNNWKEAEGKILSDLIYSEGGKIITSQHGYKSGHYILYHVMAKKVLYKCMDDLDNDPVDDGIADSSKCWQLMK